MEDTYRANKRFTIIRGYFGSGLMAFLLFLSDVGELVFGIKKKRKFVGVGPDGPYFQTECFGIRKRRRFLLELGLGLSKC